MTLCMKIAGILMEKKEVDFHYCETLEDRQNLLYNIMNHMAQRHTRVIGYSRREPEFYLDHVESKMNDAAIK